MNKLVTKDFFNYDLLSGLDKRLFITSKEDKVCLRKGTPAFEVSFPFDWACDPFKDANWCFQLHCWRSSDKALWEYFQTRCAAALQKTILVVADWHRFHILEEKTAPYSWYDMAAGIRAARIAFYLTVLEESSAHLKQDEVRKFRKCLDDLATAHINFLTNEKHIHKGNHGIFQLHGLVLLAFLLEDEKAQEFAFRKFKEIFRPQFTRHGLHSENSPEYHFFVLNLISRLKLSELFQDAIPESLLEKAQSLKPWLVMPDNRLATFGDTSSRSTWESAIHSPTTIEAAKSIHYVKDISDDGLLVVRNTAKRPDYFAVTFAGHSYVHKHADVGQIIFWYKGVLFLADPGKYIYGQSNERNRIVSARSHGVIDAYPQSLHPTDIQLPSNGTYLSGIDISTTSIAISVSFTDLHGGKYHREIRYKPESFISIKDTAFVSQSQYVSRLKFNGTLLSTGKNSTYEIMCPDTSVAVIVDGPKNVQAQKCDFGLSKEYGHIETAWVCEAVCHSGSTALWHLHLT